MPSNKTKSLDYQSLISPAKKLESESNEQATLKPSEKQTQANDNHSIKTLSNPLREQNKIETASETVSEKKETVQVTNFISAKNEAVSEEKTNGVSAQKLRKETKKVEKDRELLSSDLWLARNGHNLTYVGLYLFSILVLFRPYELISSLSFLSATAFYFAAATLIIFIPTQLANEGSLSAFSTEVKCILIITFLGVVTMPIAKIPTIAWATFNETFIKAVLMFVVMVNVIRTRRRLMGLMWLSLSVGLYLSYTALDLYMKGDLKAEGYRVEVEVGGMFGNPNDMALHLVTMTPLAITLGMASRNKIMRYFYFITAGFLIAGNMVTFSRGGFIGLLASSAVLAWKIGRKKRLKVSLASIAAGGLFILVAPGNYGLRLLSIFVPGLDPVGSSNQRQELLKRSIFVTLRNPWGIGMGNSPVMNDFNLQWHNAYMQIASEVGVLGLFVYLVFLISPFRKLGAIERTMFTQGRFGWFYYLSIGLQASIISFMFSSFFVSVAYNWFVYYLIAYAVAFRRIYQIENNLTEELKSESFTELGKNVLGWQSA